MIDNLSLATPAPTMSQADITRSDQLFDKKKVFNKREDLRAGAQAATTADEIETAPIPMDYTDHAETQYRILSQLKPNGQRYDNTGITGEMRQALFSRISEKPCTPDEMALLRDPNYVAAISKDMHSAEYIQFCEQTFTTAFYKDCWTLEETMPHRVRAVWRIIREIARSKRLISVDEPLIVRILANGPNSLDQWLMPSEVPNVPNTREYLTRPDQTANRRLLRILAESLTLPAEHWPWLHETDPVDSRHDRFHTRPGLPLMPPPVPMKDYTLAGTISEAYDPQTDTNLTLFMRALNVTAEYLGIYDGTIKDPECGRQGMMGLLNGFTVRVSFPTKMQLISWEYIMITSTISFITKHGTKTAYEKLQKEFGLNHLETNGMLRMARAFAKQLTDADKIEDRALMLLRSEEYIKRSRKALDLRAEMNGMKQMSAILGLTRMEEDAQMTDFINVIKSHSNTREQDQLASNGMKQLDMDTDDDEEFGPDYDGDPNK